MKSDIACQFGDACQKLDLEFNIELRRITGLVNAHAVVGTNRFSTSVSSVQEVFQYVLNYFHSKRNESTGVYLELILI